MVRQPSLFLLDEPLSNLDAKMRGQMRYQIIRLHKAMQKAFLYVTHDPVSYTHLDVYKRQASAAPICSPIWLRC